ncbi:MAG: ATP-binding protein, partial [Chloroflexota bacterium]
GAVESILSISRDITELKQAQLALQASEARLQAILNNAPIAIYLRDLEGRYLFVNQWAKTRTGLGEEVSEGQSVYELFPEGNRDEWWANDRKVLEAGVALEFEETTPHREGSRQYLSLKFPLFDLNGQPYAICGISTDISERKRVEEERLRLHEAERLARERAERANNHLALLSELSVALTSGLDYETITAVLARVLLPKLADWCVITLAEDDDQFKRFVAIRRDLAKEALLKEEAIRFPIPPKHVLQVLETGQPLILPEISDSFLEIISHNTEHLQLLRAIEPRSGMDVPLTVRNKTIGTIGFLSSKPNYYESGDLNLAQEIARRIALAIHNTRLYQQSQVLGQTQAELNQLKDLYMSVASHELRTPLTVARGYVQLLQRNLLRQSPNPNTSVDRSVDRTVGELASPTLPKPNSQNLTMLETILYQLDRMNGLISTLYNFSSIQNGKLELNYEQGADLLALIQRVVEQQQQANTSYVLAIQTSEKTVSGSYDEARLEQVLTNLVGNAIKYSPSGSTVTVGIACKQTPTKAGLEALLWVRDQGYGINPEDQAHIFEPFYRVRTQQTSRVVGLGLGLYISYQIVVQHKGRMWLESQVGEGTTFYFTLPLG